MTQSCKACHSSMSSSVMLDTYKISVGCDFCPTKGRVLSGPNFDDAANLKLLETIGSTCDSWGNLPPAPDALRIEASLGIGNPFVSVQLSQRPPAHNEKPIACTSCKWFVPANVVKDELGYNAPLCSAKGRLLFPTKLIAEAANCGEGFTGDSATTTQGIILHDEYQVTVPTFVTINVPDTATTVNLVAEDSRHSVDPREYVTDKEVTQEDSDNFIRAWREVADPEGAKPPIYLPIFWGEKLCGFDPRDSYGGHRPDLYVDHHGLLYDLACELMHNETPLLIGTAGTGKSETGPWLAWLMDLPHERIDIKKGYEASHLSGLSQLITDPLSGTPTTVFAKARFSATYDKPGITTINEPNVSSDCFEFLRPVFDNAKQLGNDEDSGMPPIERHSYRFILCAQNPPWDPMYVGTEPMSAADIDRVSPIWFDLPGEDVERHIIRKHCADVGYDIPADILDKVMQVAHDLRAQIDSDTLHIAWGLRAQIKVAKKTQFYSFQKAYRRAVIDGMEPEVVDAIMLSVRSVA